jgi:hypothetical protein
MGPGPTHTRELKREELESVQERESFSIESSLGRRRSALGEV